MVVLAQRAITQQRCLPMRATCRVAAVKNSVITFESACRKVRVDGQRQGVVVRYVKRCGGAPARRDDIARLPPLSPLLFHYFFCRIIYSPRHFAITPPRRLLPISRLRRRRLFSFDLFSQRRARCARERCARMCAPQCASSACRGARYAMLGAMLREQRCATRRAMPFSSSFFFFFRFFFRLFSSSLPIFSDTPPFSSLIDASSKASLLILFSPISDAAAAACAPLFFRFRLHFAAIPLLRPAAPQTTR